MPFICDLLFIFSLAFIAVNHITSLKRAHLFCVNIYYFWMITWMKKANNIHIALMFSLRVFLSFYLFFANFSPELLIKV